MQAGAVIRKAGVAPLEQFRRDGVVAQAKQVGLVRSVVKDLKNERTKLGFELLSYRRACKAVHQAPTAEGTGEEVALEAESAKAEAAEVYKAALNAYRKTHDQTFETALPSLLGDLAAVDTARIRLTKQGIQAATEAVATAAGATAFPKAAAALATILPEPDDLCRGACSPRPLCPQQPAPTPVATAGLVQQHPDPPQFKEPTVEQIMAVDSVPSSGTDLKKVGGFFGSLVDKADAAITKSTVSSKFSSFFKGKGEGSASAKLGSFFRGASAAAPMPPTDDIPTEAPAEAADAATPALAPAETAAAPAVETDLEVAEIPAAPPSALPAIEREGALTPVAKAAVGAACTPRFRARC